MRRTRCRALSVTVAAGVSALVMSAGTAAAVTQQATYSGVQALSEMTLTMPPSNYSTGATVTLECDPAGGTHPTPADACASLAAVSGNFDALERADGYVCHAGYDPVTVSAWGHWRGMPVSYQETFTNSCEAAVGTDFVFRFGI